jgi:hypothetical protein
MTSQPLSLFPAFLYVQELTSHQVEGERHQLYVTREGERCRKMDSPVNSYEHTRRERRWRVSLNCPSFSLLSKEGEAGQMGKVLPSLMTILFGNDEERTTKDIASCDMKAFIFDDNMTEKIERSNSSLSNL